MEEVIVKKESVTSKTLKLLLKIAVTVVCFWYISRKIDYTKARAALMQADWVVIYWQRSGIYVSKFLASFRLNIYFKNIGIYLRHGKI